MFEGDETEQRKLTRSRKEKWWTYEWWGANQNYIAKYLVVQI